MEFENDRHLSFLDIDIYNEPDGPWGVKSTGNLPTLSTPSSEFTSPPGDQECSVKNLNTVG
jgi:hypothetical protein